MNPKIQRILLITAFIVATIGIALLLYYVFFRSTPSTITDVTTEPSGLPTAGTGSPNTVTSGDNNFLPVEQPTEDTKEVPEDRATGGLTITRTLANESDFANVNGNNAVFYKASDAQFYKINSNGDVTPLSTKQFYGVSNVVWSPTSNEAVLEFPDGANVVYNFNTDTQVTLPKHWEDFDFSDSGDSLAFKSNALDPDNRWLGVSNTDGTSTRAIAALGENGNQIDIDWSPTKQVVALHHVQSAKDEQEIHMVGLNGENFKTITAPGLAFESQWSPTGSQLVFSVSNASTGYRPQLWIADATGENIGANRRSLPVYTWMDKCTFRNNSTLLCAVPKNLPTGAGLAPAIQSELTDDLYSINLSNGQRTLLAVPATDISMKKIMVSADDSTLFIESTNGQLYSIQL